VEFFRTAASGRGKTIVVRPVMDHIQISLAFPTFMYSYLLLKWFTLFLMV
jgi:hypothetical protein